MHKIYCGPLFVWCLMKRQRILQFLIIFSFPYTVPYIYHQRFFEIFFIILRFSHVAIIPAHARARTHTHTEAICYI